MTKNTKTILLSLLACLLLITGFELGEGRIRFGGARLNDSTATYITANKSFIVNGTIKATDSLVASGILSIGALEFDVSGTITFNYGSMIQEDAIDQLSTYTNTHKFKTEYGTEIASIDSANGVLTYLPGYSDNGRGLLKRAIYSKSYNGFTPGNLIEIAHGISPVTKIVSWNVKMYDDSTGTWYAPAYVGTTTLTTGTATTVGSTNLTHFVPAASGNWKNSGDTIRWEVLYLGN